VPALAIVIGYLLGSIPFAYIVVRLFKGADIRKFGGGNVGALNVMREVRPALGIGVLLGDVGKGALAILVAKWLGVGTIFVYLAGFAAVVGHIWPIFLRFKGGRGLATTLGVLLAVEPIQLLISFAIMVVVILITSNPRLGAIIGLTLLPLIVWGFGGTLDVILYSLSLPLFIALQTIPDFKKAFTTDRKALIVDHKYKFWQKRK
jgi:glycerol-3-phosphate acyltransferase PlsY